MPVKTIIVDDHAIVRESLAGYLKRTSEIEVVGQAANMAEARALVNQEQPDLVLLDLTLGDESGLDLLQIWSDECPEIPVLMLTMMPERLYAERAVNIGARGYLMKNEGSEVLNIAIKDVLTEKIYVNKEFRKASEDTKNGRRMKQGIELLFKRELHAFTLFGNGLKTNEVAEQMQIQAKTVETYCERIKIKLDLDNAAQFMNAASK